MHRIDTSTREKNLFGPGKDGFTGGDPLIAKPPTDLSADWFNDIQENVAQVIEGAGIELVKGDGGQLLEAVRNVVNSALIRGPWTPREAAGGYSGNFFGVTYGDGLYVAVGSNGEIQTSPDGISWTRRSSAGGFSGIFYSVAYGNGLYVAVGSNGEIQTSPDGISWTPREAAGGYSGNFFGVTYGDGLYVAVGSNGEIQTSPDGISWTRRSSAGGYSGLFRGSSYAGGLYWAAGYPRAGSPGELQYSSDGISWTRTIPVFYGGICNRVAFGAGKYVAVGESDDSFIPYIQYSEDLVTWHSFNGLPIGGAGVKSVAYVADSFACVSPVGVFTSRDAVTWTTRSEVSSNDLVEGRDLVISVGNGGAIATLTIV